MVISICVVLTNSAIYEFYPLVILKRVIVVDIPAQQMEWPWKQFLEILYETQHVVIDLSEVWPRKKRLCSNPHKICMISGIK